MKQRDRERLRYLQLQELKRQELHRPFSFLAAGEIITLHRHRSGEPVLYTDGETFFEHGTGRALFYLSLTCDTVHRYGDGLAVYWANENYLYAYADPPGAGPALYFDAAGQDEERGKYEKEMAELKRFLGDI
jgi:hypothetical protein